MLWLTMHIKVQVWELIKDYIKETFYFLLQTSGVINLWVGNAFSFRTVWCNHSDMAELAIDW